LALVPKKTRIDWGVAMKMGVALDTQSIEVEWGVARLMGVGMEKAEINNTVHLCSNQGCK
jgi:hypothetical protein